MSTLPDLTTSNIGYISYWNAINSGGVGSITASDALSDSNISSYTLYDNGWEGKYTINFSVGGSRDITVRVKQDGWFVAYTDRTNNYQTNNTGSKTNGYYDIAHDWTNHGSENSGGTTISAMPVNTLERSIHSLQSQLSNSGSITYSSSDVGLYNYEYTSATTTTIMGSSVGTHGSFTSGVLYTSGVTNYYIAAVGSMNGSGSSGRSSNLTFASNTIASRSKNQRGNVIGSLDVLTAGLMSPQTESDYSASLGYYQAASGSMVFIWG